MGRKEPLEFDRRFYRWLVKTAVGGSPIRILIELILNSADSYERLRQKGLMKPPYKIFVTYDKLGKSVEIEVKDTAEGMSAEKLKEALRYGAPTSGLTAGIPVRGALGFGLKDSLMAIDDGTIISIRDGKISEAKVVFEEGKPLVEYIREDDEITVKERKKLGINGNGTIVRGVFPRKEFAKDFGKIPTFNDVIKYLPNHFMMRKLLLIPEYNILLFKARNDVPDFPHSKLVYQPIDGKLICKEEFKVSDSDIGQLKVKLIIKKAAKDLTQRGEFRDGGLLHTYSRFGIVDCTLWGYDNEPLAQRFFGEVEIEGLERFLGEEDVIDPKRKGLNKKHPLIEKLVQALEERLRRLVEKERMEEEIARYSFDKTTKRKALAELNKIAKKLVGPGPRPPPIDECPDILLYPDTVTLREWEEKHVWLFVNREMLKISPEIELSATTDEIEIRPSKIKLIEKDFQSEEGIQEFISKSLTLLGKKAGIPPAEVKASVGDISRVMYVSIEENPKLKEEFAFVPPQTTIVDGNEKNVELIIALPLIQKNSNPARISLRSDNPKITCPQEYKVPEKLEKFILGNKVVTLPIQIKGRGVDEEANISASYLDKQASLSVRVIEPFQIGGMFKDFKPTRSGKKVSYYDKKEGIVFYNLNHPLVKKYRTGKKRKREGFLVFMADAISKTVCEAIVEMGVEREPSRYPILDYSRKEEEIKSYVDNAYYEWGPKLHDILIGLIKTLKEL